MSGVGGVVGVGVLTTDDGRAVVVVVVVDGVAVVVAFFGRVFFSEGLLSSFFFFENVFLRFTVVLASYLILVPLLHPLGALLVPLVSVVRLFDVAGFVVDRTP